jgi:hypothetical protein
MPVIAALLAGFMLAMVLVFIANRRGAAARRVYAIGLIFAAAVYVVFALAGSATTGWLAIEVLGLIGFGAAALLGVRTFPLLLAFGWALHVAWDVLLHLDGAGAAYTPSWYPWMCVSFDLVIAAAVWYSLHNRERSNTSSLRNAWTP